MLFFLSTIMHTPLQILEDVPLSQYTTLGVGGPARFLAKAQTEEHVCEALEFAGTRQCPVFVLGGGSNVVVADSGYSGLVLKIEIPVLRHATGGQGRIITVGAGVEWDAFVQHCMDLNFAGIECLSGIPGTVGGIPIQNVGAYGQEARETISRVRVWDRQDGKVAELSNSECRFAYRSSIFNGAHSNRYIVLETEFSLHPNGEPHIRYGDLQQRFGGNTPPPTLQQVRDAVIEIRKSKGMVVCEEDPDSKSVGSFFRNPVLVPGDFEKLEQQARSRGRIGADESMPCFNTPEGMLKVSAAWLIEHSGVHKGYTHAHAGISGKHSLAIINRGGATARDVVELMHLVQNHVLEAFGIELLPEPVFLGFEKEMR